MRDLLRRRGDLLLEELAQDLPGADDARAEPPRGPAPRGQAGGRSRHRRRRVLGHARVLRDGVQDPDLRPGHARGRPRSGPRERRQVPRRRVAARPRRGGGHGRRGAPRARRGRAHQGEPPVPRSGGRRRPATGRAAGRRRVDRVHRAEPERGGQRHEGRRRLAGPAGRPHQAGSRPERERAPQVQAGERPPEHLDQRGLEHASPGDAGPQHRAHADPHEEGGARRP